jgi:hypothetical protein
METNQMLMDEQHVIEQVLWSLEKAVPTRQGGEVIL